MISTTSKRRSKAAPFKQQLLDLTSWRSMQTGSLSGPGIQMSSRLGQSTGTAATGLQSGSKAPQEHWQPSPVPYCSGLHVQALGMSAASLTLISAPMALGRTPFTWYKYAAYAQVKVQHTLKFTHLPNTQRELRGLQELVIGSHVMEVSPPPTRP